MSDPAELRAFEVRVVDAGDAALIVMSGDLDIASAPQVEDVLAGVPEDRRIVLDLRALTFMDSSGVGLLVTAAQRKMPAGTRLGCIAGPPQVQRILEITGADGLVEWVAAP